MPAQDIIQERVDRFNELFGAHRGRTDREVLRLVSELTKGDRVDLAGDSFADPDGTAPLYKNGSLQVVRNISWPAIPVRGLVTVHFDEFSIVFPESHEVRIARD